MPKILSPMLQMGKLRLGATEWPHQALLLGVAELQHRRQCCLFCFCHRTEDHSQLFPSSDLGCCSTLPWLYSDQWPPSSIAVEFKSGLFWTFDEMLWNFVLFLPHLHKWKTAPEQGSCKKNLGPMGLSRCAGPGIKSKVRILNPQFYCFKKFKFTASRMEASSFFWSQA